MKRLAYRLRLAVWAFRNADKLARLRREVLADFSAHRLASMAASPRAPFLIGYHDGRYMAAKRYALQLHGMPRQ